MQKTKQKKSKNSVLNPPLRSPPSEGRRGGDFFEGVL